MAAVAQTNVASKEVTYKIHYKSPSCYDDGGLGHDEFWSDSSKLVDAKTDKEAQIASIGDEFHTKEYCHHGRCCRPTKIEKIVVETTADGFSRTTISEVPLPIARRCPCGKTYMPILGETACHELKSLSTPS